MTPTATGIAPQTTPAPTTGAIPTFTPTIEVLGPLAARYDEVLTPEAVAFLTELHQRFDARRRDRLADRMRRRYEIGNGHDPSFRADTAGIRNDPSWRVAGAGPGLHDRRVEITGPTDPKMTINALNSGAKVWLADQEDATSPTWKNVVEGQLSLFDAIRGQLSFTSPSPGRMSFAAATIETVGRSSSLCALFRRTRLTAKIAISPNPHAMRIGNMFLTTAFLLYACAL